MIFAMASHLKEGRDENGERDRLIVGIDRLEESAVAAKKRLG